MTEYTAEETADYLHMLDDRLTALEGKGVEGLPENASVSINEAAGFFRVSRRTIYNWIAAKKLRYGLTPSGKVRVFTDSLAIREGISVD